MTTIKLETVRFGDMKPGQQFHYLDTVDTYMKIRGITSIGKEKFNCVDLDDGGLHYLPPDTAVLLKED